MAWLLCRILGPGVIRTYTTRGACTRTHTHGSGTRRFFSGFPRLSHSLSLLLCFSLSLSLTLPVSLSLSLSLIGPPPPPPPSAGTFFNLRRSSSSPSRGGRRHASSLSSSSSLRHLPSFSGLVRLVRLVGWLKAGLACRSSFFFFLVLIP